MTDTQRQNTTLIAATDRGLAVTVGLASAMNYALVHNGVSPLHGIAITNHTAHKLEGLSLELRFEDDVVGRIAEPFRALLPDVEPNESVSLPGDGVPWVLDTGTFAHVDEAVTVEVSLRVTAPGRDIRGAGSIRVLARDEWWALSIPESLAAFVTPRARAVQELVSEASDLLGARSGDPSMQGYLGGTERALEIARSIYDAMKAREIRYIITAASFEGTGQKIRLPDEVLVDRFGNCLDLATTFAAALESAGLNPILVVCDGHAFTGHLLDDQQLPELVVRDRGMITNLVDSRTIVPLETTALVAGRSDEYFDASQAPRADGWWTSRLDDVRFLVDVRCAHRYVRPIPAVHTDNGVRVVEVERTPATVSDVLPPPPASPDPKAPASRGALPREVVYPPRVARWRNSLLDLSFRNPLLNMRPGASSVDLHVPHGALGLLEDMMFAGQTISVQPHDELAEIHQARGARTAQDISAEELEALLRSEATLYGAVTAAAYPSRLRGIHRRARTVLEETGANNLFLTLGSLTWEDSGRDARAPLFLLPVSTHAPRGKAFTMQIDEGASAQPNQCLLEKLRVSKGLTIPHFENPEGDASGIDLAGSMQAIREALIASGLPFSVEETASLSILQFTTLQLWQDISENWQTFLRNPVVRHLIETPTDSFVDPAAATPVPVGAEADAYCPIPADGSQLEAVSWAEAGRSFVLEGPPGTGKSQTITNLIANALATGKTVLFVAEKQAALDVVRRRLEAVGIGDLCLDLHGKDQTPGNVRAQLREALHLRASGNAEAWGAVRARHKAAIDSLARYPGALHEPGGAGLSAWTARQSLLGVGAGPEVEVPVTLVSTPVDAEALYRSARELTEALFDLGAGVELHIWRFADRVDLGAPGLRQQLTATIAQLETAVAGLNGTVAGDLLRSGPSQQAPALVRDWLITSSAIGRTIAPDLAAAAAAPKWQTQLEAAGRTLAELRTDAASLLSVFKPDVVGSTDLDQMLIRSKAADEKFFKGKARKAIVADLAGVARESASIDHGTLTPTLEALIALRARCRGLGRDYAALAGVELPDGWNPLSDGAEIVVEQQAAAVTASVLLRHDLPGAAGVLQRATVNDCSAGAFEQLERLAGAWMQLTSMVSATPPSISDWCGGETPLFTAIANALPALAADARDGAFVQLSRWVRMRERLAALTNAGLGGVEEGLKSGRLQPDDVEAALRRGIARAALTERRAVPMLAGFDGVARDRAIDEFEAAGEELRRDMMSELPSKIVSDRSFSADHLVGKVGELSRELARKRGGFKIRELFEHFGPIIAELTPCLMMSPHSVARFLPPDALVIDLAVFDEASQIRVAEAISAMGRAAATVVVGDSQQMPPTNIGVAGRDADDDEHESTLAIPTDMESVLSEAVESSLPRLWLSWHYRSHHESLISFSNHRYYEGRLASFPTPPEQHTDLGVTWRRVNGTFERGKARVNREEADLIIEEIAKRLADDPGASIGVVTFNVQQRDLILDLLEETSDARIAKSLLDEKEPLFVKNLENVQGDERDVILFSLAFSVDPVTGRLPLNFGPLVQAGGERRLNVAVTRAREQVVVFSSFDPGHVDLTRSASVGLAHLRSYLEMAQRSSDTQSAVRAVRSRDLHREDVVAGLEAAGLMVRTDVGLSEFKVDIGVAASPDGPWVAVFLDGPDYASRETVGDRESLPHGVLTGSMGWARVARIWLPDWLRDPDEVIRRIVETANTLAPPEDPAEQPEQTDVRAPQEPAPLPAPPPSRPEQPVFTPADERPVGVCETLDAIGHDAAADAAVLSQISDVLAQEGPIEATRLARIVGRRFDLSRVASKRVEAIVGLVPAGQLDETKFGRFAWRLGQTPADYGLFRLAPVGGSREVDEIAPQETLNAMAHLARISGGISRDELVRETALLFGMRRVTAKVGGHLNAVLDEGVAAGRFSENGAVVSIED